MEALNKWTSKTSIRGKLVIYNCIIFALVMLVVMICGISNFRFLSLYNESSNQYKELSLFYSNLRQANVNIQNYCYSLSEKDYSLYSSDMSHAYGNAEALGNGTGDGNMSFRFSLLSNMLDTFEAHISALRKNASGVRPAYTREYEYITRLYGLIDRTSSEYFNLITKDTMMRRMDMINQWKRQVYTIVAIVCLIVTVAIGFSFLSVRSITRPIDRIVKNIQKIKKGKYNLKEVKGAGKEFAILCEAFDDMAASVRDNIAAIEKNAQLRNQLLETENENLRMQELLTDTELKALQGQINPHFLFNTLSMISKMAYIENAPKTSELMEITSELLRYSLDKSSRTSTLYEELDCVRNYFYIQRMRFGERVHFELNVQENLPDIKIPGMIIQPIIENSVIHGVSGMTENAVISVDASCEVGFVKICIEDNGRGMSSEKIENVMQDSAEDSISLKNTNIGIYNVKRRLEMFYGARVFNIDSSEGCGTQITISIPLRGEEDFT